jgi:hypothetical protein
MPSEPNREIAYAEQPLFFILQAASIIGKFGFVGKRTTRSIHLASVVDHRAKATT